jgi:hypothetical protein
MELFLTNDNMGWSDCTIAYEFERLIMKYVPKEKWKEEGRKALDILEAEDWDQQDEVPLFSWLNDIDMLLNDNCDDDEHRMNTEKAVAKFEKKHKL